MPLSFLSSYSDLTSGTVGNVIISLIPLLAHGKNLLRGVQYRIVHPGVSLLLPAYYATNWTHRLPLAIPLLNFPIPLTALLTSTLPSPISSAHSSQKDYSKEPMSFPWSASLENIFHCLQDEGQRALWSGSCFPPPMSGLVPCMLCCSYSQLFQVSRMEHLWIFYAPFLPPGRPLFSA